MPSQRLPTLLSRTLVLFLLCVLGLSVGVANTQFKIITLKHRQAAAIMPLVKPLMKRGDTLTGHDYTLIVKTSPSTMREVMAAVRAFDKPAKQLVVSIKLSHALNNRREYVYGETVGRARNANEMQSVQVLDGERAYITLGKEIPYTTISMNANNTVVGTQYRAMISGFYVTPRLTSQDKVSVKIDQQLQTRNNSDYNSIRSQSVGTTVTIPVNRWVPLAGAAARNATIRRRQIRGTTKTASVFIRVQVLRAPHHK